MLKQRILTAMVLIPLFIALVLLLPPMGFALMTAIIIVGCAVEWSGLLGMTTFPYKLIYPVLILLVLFAALWLKIPDVLIVTFIWWLFAGVLVLLYPKASHAWGKGKMVRSLMGFFVLIPCWIAINFIRNLDHGTYTLLFLFVLIWGADSGAYFVGKKWGKHKLAPAVSPGKSWQGLCGALLTSGVIALAVLYSLKIPYGIWLGMLVLAIVTVLFSVLGDLFESMLKRQAGVKDSGQILPGHGGLLDRLDSLTAAAPIFALGILLLGKM